MPATKRISATRSRLGATAAVAPLLVGLLAGMLAACGNGAGSGPGAVSEGEAKALEEAAEMLDQRRLPEGALPDIDVPPQNETLGSANRPERADPATEQQPN